MSVMTTGRPGGTARVTALPRPRTDEEDRSAAGESQPGQERAAGAAGEPRPGPGQPQVAAFRQVSGHRRVREFRQVREVQVAREFRVVRAAAGGGASAAATVSGMAMRMPGRALQRPAQRGGIRLTRRGRVVVAALLTMAALLVMALVWLTAAASAQAAGSGPPPGAVYRNLTSVVVHPGQTLWSIASQAQPSADPRIVMQEIVDLNALHGTSLMPGQRLWVPRG
ncbi:MAG TPA: LysM peptidoglycan-binding domain-containing protein [Streptosporangiaceae bacterium]